MKKLESLRSHLINSVPGLKKNPDRLLAFIEDGSIEFHRGQHLSHQYTVPARIILTDFSGDTDSVIIPLLQWLSHYQPDLKPDEAVRFQAELLSNRAWDLSIEVTLTERVVALVDCAAGKITAEHRAPEFPIESCPSKNWELYIRDSDTEDDYQLIAQWTEVDG
jgi:hypothetical protein